MKFIRIYIEVGNDGTPIYADEFVANAKKTENVLIASKEYVDLLEDIEKDNVLEIPSDIMQLYDKNLLNIGSRHITMKIYENNVLDEWIQKEIKAIDDEVMGVYMRGEYCSILSAAWKIHVAAYVQNENRKYDEQDNEKKYKLMIDSLEKRNEYLDSIVKQNEKTIESMKAAIESNNNYIHNLQIHATNLDNNLKKYKAFYDENADTVENYADRIQYAEKEINHYVDLYKNLLDELDELKTENLEMKQKIRK